MNRRSIFALGLEAIIITVSRYTETSIGQFIKLQNLRSAKHFTPFYRRWM